MRGKLRRRESLPLADRRSEGHRLVPPQNLSPCHNCSASLILASMLAWSEAEIQASVHLRLAPQVYRAVRDCASSGKGSAPAPRSSADGDPTRMAGLAVQAGARFCKRAMLPAAGRPHAGRLPGVEPSANGYSYNTQPCETEEKGIRLCRPSSFSCSVHGWWLLFVEAR